MQEAAIDNVSKWHIVVFTATRVIDTRRLVASTATVASSYSEVPGAYCPATSARSRSSIMSSLIFRLSITAGDLESGSSASVVTILKSRSDIGTDAQIEVVQIAQNAVLETEWASESGTIRFLVLNYP